MTQGERVREIRKALGLTLEKFGDKLGVGKTAISKIEAKMLSLIRWQNPSAENSTFLTII